MSKKILIIGGTKGLGKSLAIKSKKKGYQVFVFARHKSIELENLGVNCLVGDFTQEDIANNLLMDISPNILVLCVAKGLYKDLSLITNEDITSVVNHSFTHNLIWIKEGIDLMKSGSSIAWVSSLTAFVPDSTWSIYAACKAGVTHYLESICNVAHDKEISLTTCFPGCLDTDFHQNSGAIKPEIAVNPDLIVSDMLNAIETKQRFWSAPMDKAIINSVYDNKNDLLNKNLGALK